MQRTTLTLKSLGAVIMAGSIGMAAHGQTVIDPLTGSLSPYTTYLVNDTSLGAGQGVSFTSSGSGLSANYVGTGTSPEQALFLAPSTSFSTTFSVGQTLLVNSTVAASSTAQDYGLAISAASPVGGNAGNSFNSRTAFDWASISLRPNQSGGGIRVNSSIGGVLNTAGGALSPSLASVTGLYITWASADVFNVGYITTGGVMVQDEAITFGSGSTIGSEIGFYGDLRATGTSIGSFSNLTIQPVPEPSTLALSGMGLAGLVGVLRRKK